MTPEGRRSRRATQVDLERLEPPTRVDDALEIARDARRARAARARVSSYSSDLVLAAATRAPLASRRAHVGSLTRRASAHSYAALVTSSFQPRSAHSGYDAYSYGGFSTRWADPSAPRSARDADLPSVSRGRSSPRAPSKSTTAATSSSSAHDRTRRWRLRVLAALTLRPPRRLPAAGTGRKKSAADPMEGVSLSRRCRRWARMVEARVARRAQRAPQAPGKERARADASSRWSRCRTTPSPSGWRPGRRDAAAARAGAGAGAGGTPRRSGTR